MSQSLNFFISSSRSPNFTISKHYYPKPSFSTCNRRLPVMTFVRRQITALSSDLDLSSSSPVIISDNSKCGGLLSVASRECHTPSADSSSIKVEAVMEVELKENEFWSTKRTKLGCTIWPATCGFEQLEELAVGGMNVLQINMCHGTREWHQSFIESVRRLNEEKGYIVAIMMDTEGSEIHMGDLSDGKIGGDGSGSWLVMVMGLGLWWIWIWLRWGCCSDGEK